LDRSAMLQNRQSTAPNVLTQRRQHPVRRVAISIVTNVSQSVGVQASPLRHHTKPSILKLLSNLLQCKHVVKKVWLGCCHDTLRSVIVSTLHEQTG
jgi:hypothetical protein